ncbi:MAG: molybdopterin-guanine dinucleotide biosynthesis protein B [Desulfobulbaceae bacterium]|nr:molybdopterin-guanine dinucleotide biosynthesis protein B [Desulfobulbaceae bacterium]HIJ91103.1 molybdopterin-guanine dinucleotide biosynthesis protein B [Deltaproteobacteria bacterium]
MPPVIAFIGKPDSGKTTLLEKLIPELRRRGYRIGTIKHHVHTFEMDKPGKDTWRHKQAGASTVALSSPTGLGIIRDVDEDLSIEELVGRYYGDIDLVITEGYKRLALPKIEIFRSTLHDAPLPDRDDTWIAMVSDIAGATDLPCFGLDDIIGLADFLEERFIKPFPRQKTSLLVNGRPVYLNAFVESFLRQAITGMTCSLKGCQDPQEIIITIRQAPPE